MIWTKFNLGWVKLELWWLIYILQGKFPNLMTRPHKIILGTGSPSEMIFRSLSLQGINDPSVIQSRPFKRRSRSIMAFTFNYSLESISHDMNAVSILCYKFLLHNIQYTSSELKNRRITKNCIDSLSNLWNGMFQTTILGILDIYCIKNRLIRYLWKLKNPVFSIMPSSRKMNKINSLIVFCPLFSKCFLFTLFKTWISQKVCYFEQQNKIHIISI